MPNKKTRLRPQAAAKRSPPRLIAAARQGKIAIIVGSRPNFIKLAPFLAELKKKKSLNPILIHTGQHYDFNMSEVFFSDLKIGNPKYNLGIRAKTNGEQVGKMIIDIEKILIKENPLTVVVIGDVNSTLAGALSASKLNIPVAHIESGLRSGDKTMPEEINRVLTDHISDILFCPTKNSAQKLKNEGIKKGIIITGDINYDIFLKSQREAKEKPDVLKKLKIEPKKYFLLTVHRPGNADNLENFKNILKGLSNTNETIIFPIHPRTKKIAKKLKIFKIKNIKVISPVGYLDMLSLVMNAKKLITDSGGLQKEAYWLKVPCITLRNSTEWIETVKDGWNILVGSDAKKIKAAVLKFNPNKNQKKHFGNGKSAKKMVSILMKNI